LHAKIFIYIGQSGDEEGGGNCGIGGEGGQKRGVCVCVARIPPLLRNSGRKNGVGVSTRVCAWREELHVCVTQREP